MKIVSFKLKVEIEHVKKMSLFLPLPDLKFSGKNLELSSLSPSQGSDVRRGCLLATSLCKRPGSPAGTRAIPHLLDSRNLEPEASLSRTLCCPLSSQTPSLLL